jgi:hypothetical protein
MLDVIQTLRNGGFAVERGFPAAKAVTISEPVCAVNLLKADMRGQTQTVLITVLSPMELGAAVCEDAALSAGRMLNDRQFSCDIGNCNLNGRTGLYEIRLTVAYSTDLKRFMINEVQLGHVVAFDYSQKWLPGMEDVSEAPWEFRLEEFIPHNADEEEQPEGTFTLLHNHTLGLMTFTECTWTLVKRTWTPEGIRQIREGKAQAMDLT